MMNRKDVEIHQWQGEGYKPLVFHNGWQTALLNWEPVFDLENIGEIERHCHTDEVFVLVKGKAVLFTIDLKGILQVYEMIPNVIYNVTQSSWHNLIATKDATWIIVENRDTHINDTEFKQLTNAELEKIMALLPDWSKT